MTQKNLRRRIWAFVRLFLGILRDFWKESRIARRRGLAAARREMSTRHRRRAVQFRAVALQLGGVLIKLGQFFSTRVDVMPKEYIEELAKLQDTVPPVGVEEARRVIEGEFGRPLEEVFATFEPEAFAAASLAQAHRATLPDGTAVVVKLQRPGIDTLSDVDLATFSYLMDGVHRFTKFGRQTDIPLIVDEFVRTVGDELDFVREADNARRFKTYFENNQSVYVPDVYSDYTTNRVLTLEAIEGIKISDFAAIESAGIDRKKVAQEIIDSYLKQVLEDGFFHADPHPGNLFVADGPLITFIDFGMVGEITPQMKEAFKQAVIGIAQRDSEKIIDALRVLGFVRPGADVASIKSALEWLIDNYANLRASDLTFADVQEIHEDILIILRDQPLTIPAQFAFLGKTLGTMIGLAGSLDPKIDLIEATKPYVAKLTKEVTDDWFKLISQEVTETAKVLWGLPKQIRQTLELAQSGRLKVKISGADLARAVRMERGRERRRAGAVFAGLLVVAGAWLIGLDLTREGYAFAAGGFLVYLLRL